MKSHLRTRRMFRHMFEEPEEFLQHSTQSTAASGNSRRWPKSILRLLMQPRPDESSLRGGIIHGGDRAEKHSGGAIGMIGALMENHRLAGPRGKIVGAFHDNFGIAGGGIVTQLVRQVGIWNSIDRQLLNGG